jgi:hypothetical protein
MYGVPVSKIVSMLSMRLSHSLDDTSGTVFNCGLASIARLSVSTYGKER